MSRRNKKGYRGYQGRNGRSSAWVKGLVGLLAVLVICGGAYLLGRDGGLSFLELQAADPLDKTDQTMPTETPAPTPAPTPTPTPALEEIRGVEVNTVQLLDGGAQWRLDKAVGDAVVVDVKGADGKLYWPSQVEQAGEIGAVASQKSLESALKQLSDQGVYLVARVECFRDQKLADANADGSVLMSQWGKPWYDAKGMRWVSPLAQSNRDYLVELCRELARMGFDELVLDASGFPDQGKLQTLAPSEHYPQERSVAVETFWKQLTQELQGEGVVLSAQVRGETLVDGGVNTGLTPEILNQYARRVWVSVGREGEQAVEQVLRESGIDAKRQMIPRKLGSGQLIWAH